MTDVLIALGSNLGDRRGYLRSAVRRLGEEGFAVSAASALYATAAVGIEGGGEFLNAVVSGRTDLPPRELLGVCRRIEKEAGREGVAKRRDAASTPPTWFSRTLDLDLLRYGDCEIDEPDLIVPHPRITERPFVLAPLREVAPEWNVGGRTVSCWYEDASRAGVNRLDGTENWFWH